jgi:hypothetical protein
MSENDGSTLKVRKQVLGEEFITKISGMPDRNLVSMFPSTPNQLIVVPVASLESQSIVGAI